MKRNFYLILEVARKELSHRDPKEAIELIYPDSDIKDHLVYKLSEKIAKTPFYIMGWLNFYESLDSQNQFIFDSWFNAQVELLDAKTIQHMV